MAWIDVDGVEHVSGSDVPSEWGDDHIRGCVRCQGWFPGSAYFLLRDAR